MKRFNSRFCGTTLAFATAAMLMACGGGGGASESNNADTSSNSNTSTSTSTSTSIGVTPVPVAQASSNYIGPITGFGSVIVNGVRFSTVGASMKDDDGQSVNLSDLKLGMTVHIKGDADDVTRLGTASQLELVHGNRGNITAVNSAAGTLTLLGQTIKTNSGTAYHGTGGLTSLSVGQVVEVYGVRQADGTLLATLVEVKAALGSVSIVGNVSNLGASTFQVGTQTINFSTASVSGVLTVGKRVKVRASAGVQGGVLTASSVDVEAASSVNGAVLMSGARLKIKGVAASAPVNGVLTVSGTQVDVSKALVKGGGAILAGQFIEVYGNWDGSVLQATQVELEGYYASQSGGENELYGTVTSVNGNLVVVNGVTIDLSKAGLSQGSLAQIAVGRYIEIKGTLTGNAVLATWVEIKTNSTASGLSYEQYGIVSAFVSIANFKVKGLTVDASNARFEHGNAQSLGNGVYVEIEGAQNDAGVFIARKIEIKTGGRD
jgi:hypothetical protein